MARDMVTRYGMSKLGNITYGEHKGSIFLGKELMHERNYSEDTAKLIDAEVKSIVHLANDTAHKLVLKHKKALQEVAAQLLKKETLTQEEFLEIVDGKKPAKPTKK
jgi:cell division protease FtsH